MRVITPGHSYYLDNMDYAGDGTVFKPSVQILNFIHKEKQGDAFVTVQDGTTNEEVLRVLIDRLKTLSAKLPSRQTSIAITKCEEALMWLENRTAERASRGVEGTPKA